MSAASAPTISLGGIICPLYFAGIFETLADGNLCCAIVTQPARGAIHDIHPRMPLALDDNSLSAWLGPTRQDRQAIQELVKPLHPELLTAWRVSTRVNNVRNDDARLMEPLDDNDDLTELPAQA